MKRPFTPRSNQYAMPMMWRIFVEWLGLDESLGKKWWQSLMSSRWSQAVILCQNIRLAPFLKINPLAMVHENVHPSVVIHVTEDLVTQGLLTRKEANEIENVVLHMTKAVQGCHKHDIPASLGRALYASYTATPAQGWK